MYSPLVQYLACFILLAYYVWGDPAMLVYEAVMFVCIFGVVAYWSHKWLGRRLRSIPLYMFLVAAACILYVRTTGEPYRFFGHLPEFHYGSPLYLGFFLGGVYTLIRRYLEWARLQPVVDSHEDGTDSGKAPEAESSPSD